MHPKNKLSFEELNELLNQLVSNGMRAQLKPRNILTGSLYVDLVPEYQPEPSSDAQMARYGGYWVLPSAKNQELQIVRRVSDIAKRIEALPRLAKSVFPSSKEERRANTWLDSAISNETMTKGELTAPADRTAIKRMALTPNKPFFRAQKKVKNTIANKIKKPPNDAVK